LGKGNKEIIVLVLVFVAESPLTHPGRKRGGKKESNIKSEKK
jgi:hypothetical protein